MSQEKKFSLYTLLYLNFLTVGTNYLLSFIFVLRTKVKILGPCPYRFRCIRFGINLSFYQLPR